MTSTNQKRLLILGLTIFVVGIIVLLTIFDKEDEVVLVEEKVEVVQEDGLGISGEVNIPSTPSGLEVIAEEVPIIEGRTASLQMSELFAERYGSYSNQGDYQNLKDLLSIMTASYRSTTEDFLTSVEGAAPALVYEGYTATKISSEEISYNESSGTAQYEVVLQQLKIADNEELVIEYPVLRVGLQRIDDDWFVAKAEWIR